MHAMEEEFKHEQAKATNKFNTTLQELKEKNTEVFLLAMIFADCEGNNPFEDGFGYKNRNVTRSFRSSEKRLSGSKSLTYRVQERV